MKNLRTLKESLKNLFKGNAKVDRKGINGKKAIAIGGAYSIDKYS